MKSKRQEAPTPDLRGPLTLTSGSPCYICADYSFCQYSSPKRISAQRIISSSIHASPQDDRPLARLCRQRR